jgi:hypothetical protein
MLTVYQVPRFVPAMGSTSFWHKKTRFRLYRKKESLMNSSGWQAMKDQEEIKISCYGRSISKFYKYVQKEIQTINSRSADKAAPRGS